MNQVNNCIKHINPHFSWQILDIDYTLTCIVHTQCLKCKTIVQSLQPQVTLCKKNEHCLFLVQANQDLFPVMSHSSSLEAKPVSPDDLLRLLFFPEPLLSVTNCFQIQLRNHLPSALCHQAKRKSLFHLKISQWFSRTLKTPLGVGPQ